MLIPYCSIRRARRSLPARGAWIEIANALTHYKNKLSLPARGAWIEIDIYIEDTNTVVSLPARGAWIEIHLRVWAVPALPVAPRTGSVD